jgi:hypothetical protein
MSESLSAVYCGSWEGRRKGKEEEFILPLLLPKHVRYTVPVQYTAGPEA